MLFVGGLGDGLATTSYTADLAAALAPTDWSFFTLALSSSHQAWGLGQLDTDADEIARCARHVRDYKRSKFGGGNNNKLVLMGHSTGSQCVLHYLSRQRPDNDDTRLRPEQQLEPVGRPVAVDGAVMQAPVSDREAILWVLQHGFKGRSAGEVRAVCDDLVGLARKEAAAPEAGVDAVLPLWMTSYIYPADTPIGTRRFLSLFSPDSPGHPGEDDMFSSDLADGELDKTFGKIRDRGLLRGRLLVLMSGADQAVPDWVDKERLLARWRAAADRGAGAPVWDRNSGLIPGASHALSNDDQAEPRRFLVAKVLGYLQAVEDGQ